MNMAVAPNHSSEKTTLPEDFVFSQSSLQTYVDCKRKFWLTYVNQLQWPAAPASPVGEFERMLRLGARFHRMVQRAEEGIAADDVLAQVEYPLSSWFDAYQNHRPKDLPSEFKLVERTFETIIQVDAGTRRLMAKYDLVAADDERTIILDWKTGSRVTRPAILQQMMQSNVYPYVLVESSSTLPWGPLKPEQVEMRYWFVAAPASTTNFPYDQAQHVASRDAISRIVQSILQSDDSEDFPLVPDTEHNRKYVCGFCPFRGFCDRGQFATDLAEIDDFAYDDLIDAESFLDFSLDDVEQIPH